MSNFDALEQPDVDETDLPRRQYLTFMLAGEEFALDILRVQEIRGWCRATLVPNSADYMCGVINLRGDIIPVVDLRVRFGLSREPYSATTVVVVVRVCSNSKERIMGVVVDAMAETYNILERDITPAPQVGGLMDPEYVHGLATIEDKMVVVLDVDALMNTADVAVDNTSDNES